jgi:pimeloyl-ACP methyl ester carboxylesterase
VTGIQIFGNLVANPTITSALVVVHGAERNAKSALEHGQTAAKKAGVGSTTLVLAPWFKTKADHPAKGEPVWSSDDWKSGGGKVSSFAVMDDLLAQLADRKRFPKLVNVALAGHSAGGQFVQRYAIFGRAQGSVSYVVVNPSSYCYLGPERPSTDGSTYTVPKTPCAFDRYKYGLARRAGYVAELTAEQARAQYTARRVTILSGGADITHEGALDTSCPAMLQGPHRRARGAYFSQRYPSPSHDRVVIPGVGHDAARMLASPLAWPALFGTGA